MRFHKCYVVKFVPGGLNCPDSSGITVALQWHHIEAHDYFFQKTGVFSFQLEGTSNRKKYLLMRFRQCYVIKFIPDGLMVQI